MDYIKEAFARMDLRQLRSFLLYGTDEYAVEVQPYQETILKAREPVNALLDSLCPDGAERDKAAADLNKALTTCEYVYMELGMKAGARLLYQLLLANGQPPEGTGKN